MNKQQKEEWFTLNEGEKFACKCSATGIGMNEGWYVNNDYLSTQELADIEAISSGYKDFEDMYNDLNPDDDDDISLSCFERMSDRECYWTTWEIIDDDFYQVIDGKLYHLTTN